MENAAGALCAFCCIIKVMTSNSQTKSGIFNFPRQRGFTSVSRAWGFTLVEMLVIIAIISVLTIMTLVAYYNSNRQYNLKRATDLFVADIRRAQNLALSGQSWGERVPHGYGIHIESSGQYTLFFTTDNSEKTHGGPNSYDIETISLPSGVTFPVNRVGDNIFFVPPDPTSYINSNKTFNFSRSYILTNRGLTKTVTVYNTGRIEY